MLQNYFKTTFRTLWKHKSYSFIHVLGLTIGISCCLLIYLFVKHELSFDQYHSQKDRIYRVNYVSDRAEGREIEGHTPYPMAPAMRTDFPDLAAVARVHFSDDQIIKIDEQKKFKEYDVLFAEPYLLDIFDFEIVAGNGKKALAQPNQVIISESLAKKYFETIDAVGKNLTVDNQLNLTVGAVMKDSPRNTHLHSNILISFESMTEKFLGLDYNQWGFVSAGSTYILLADNMTVDQIRPQFEGYIQKYREDGPTKRSIHLQALSDIHFQPNIMSDTFAQPVSPEYLWIFSIIGIFVLLIACINFINLSTAQAIERSKEVGVRKVLGAERHQLIGQFLGEALVISFIGGLLAVQMTELALPFLNQLMDQSLVLNILENPMTLLITLIIVIVTGLLAGGYPAFVLSNYEPVTVLKGQGTTTGTKSSLLLRRSLVIGQFGITLVLMIGTIVISRQMNFLKNKDLGFNKDAVLVIEIPDAPKEILRTELLQNPNIEEVSFNLGAPTSGNNFNTSAWRTDQSSDEAARTNIKPVDRHYLKTYGLELIEGRWFKEQDDKNVLIDLDNKTKPYVFVVNEVQATKLGYASAKEIVGQKIHIGLNSIVGEVIGVVNDFNVASLHDEMEGVIMMNFPHFFAQAGVKMKPTELSKSLAFVEKTWSKHYPDYLFDYSFLDNELAEMYDAEERIFFLFRIFSGLAILIACLGLWGLAAFTIKKQTKEIGIRKILGASTWSLLGALNFQFAKLVIAAFIIAIPVAYYALKQWLANFAYAIDINIGAFLLAGFAAIIIASLTISFHTVRAALANPVKALRNE